jgi:hypothetical protein
MAEALPPPGSQAVARWAAGRRYAFQLAPDDAWYRSWEPLDTLLAPARYVNAVATSVRRAQLVVVEPWMAYGDDAPLARSLFAFVSHPRVRGRASMHVGQSHVTRVTFLHSPPPPKQRFGDGAFDEVAVAYAPAPGEMALAFPPTLLAFLRSSSFEGHLEVRYGGFVLYRTGLAPTPAGYEAVLALASEVLGRLVLSPSALP